jgi:hypothetical protein
MFLERIPGEVCRLVAEIEYAIKLMVFVGSQVSGNMNIVWGKPGQVFMI